MKILIILVVIVAVLSVWSAAAYALRRDAAQAVCAGIITVLLIVAAQLMRNMP